MKDRKEFSSTSLHSAEARELLAVLLEEEGIERLCCKDKFESRKFFEYISLSGDPEQRSDERRLSLRITSG
jgi:hypothetical protein